MSTFTVKSVAPEPREWKSTHGGTFLSYKVDLQEENGPLAMGVEWNKKPESQAPQVGELVAGHLEEGRYAEKFKIDYEASKELKQGGGGATTSARPQNTTKGAWQPESERDPERSARILRQHSQEVAARLMVGHELRFDLDELFKIADRLDRDVNAAGQAAIQGAGSASGVPASSSQGVSPSNTAPAPESQSASDLPPAEDQVSLEGHRLDEHLFNAKVSDSDERRWLVKAWEGMDAERRGVCLASLSMGDQAAKTKALNRLREIAGPMPDDFREKDDIPF